MLFRFTFPEFYLRYHNKNVLLSLVLLFFFNFSYGQPPTWNTGDYTNSGSTTFRNGNVAIGSSNTGSGAKLLISGAGDVTKDLIVNGRMQTGDANGNGGLWVGNDDKVFVGRINASIGFYNNGFWRLQVDPSGNVGIGITPTAQLHLADIYAAGGKNLQIGDDTYFSDIDVGGVLGLYSMTSAQPGLKFGGAGPTIFGGNNGFLGIGTTTPSQMLEVAGTIKASGLVFPDGTSQTTASPYTYTISSQQGPPGQGLSYTYVYTHASGLLSTMNNSHASALTLGGNGKFISLQGTISFGGNTTFYDKVSIGTKTNTNTDALLAVNGTIYSTKCIVSLNNWADDEFLETAQTPTLDQEETIALEEHHLIGVPKEKEIIENGLDLGEMQAIQMRKIEQLYKHLFTLSKQNEALKAKVESLEKQLKK